LKEDTVKSENNEQKITLTLFTLKLVCMILHICPLYNIRLSQGYLFGRFYYD